MDKGYSHESPQDPALLSRMDNRMRALVFKDITIEVPSPDDCFLTDVSHLILEAAAEETILGHTNLLSRSSAPWIWDLDRTPCFVEMFSDFTMSVWMRVDEGERQLLASATFNGQELYDAKEVELQMTMTRHEDYPDLIFKAKVIGIEDVKSLPPDLAKRSSTSFDGSKTSTLLKQIKAALGRFENDGNAVSLEKAMLHLQTVINLAAEDEPTLPTLMNALGATLGNRFRKSGHIADLNNAIAKFQASVDLAPDSDPSKPYSLEQLAMGFIDRFHELGNITDLNNAIEQLQIAVELTPDTNPQKADYLNQLGKALADRFKKLDNIVDIDQAIARQQEVVDLTPDGYPEKPEYLNNLGRAFQVRSFHSSDISDIDIAIGIQQAALDLTTDGHRGRPTYFSDLGITLANRFAKFGDLSDINDAIMNKQAAVHLTPDGNASKPDRLNSLGESLLVRFQRLGNIVDLNNSVEQLQAAVDLTADENLHKPEYLRQLGVSLSTRFRQFGDVADIENAIVSEQSAVCLTPDGHPSKNQYLSSIGSSLQMRFERLGNLADIDRAIASQQAAIDLTPDNDSKKANYLHILGSSLTTRFLRLGRLVDIDNAIKQQEVALDLVPDGSNEKPIMLNALGVSLHIRFERTGNLADIDNAIERQETAVGLAPDGHPLKPTFLISLGNSFSNRYKRLEKPADLDNGIARQQEALDLTPADHPERPRRLNNLGTSLFNRFGDFGKRGDLDSALERLQAAVDLVPEGHPDRSMYLNNLARITWILFGYSKNPRDLTAAISHLSSAATSPVGTPLNRLKAAETWMNFAESAKHESLLAACECALGLLPLVAWLGLPISDRHQHLIRIGGIARDAAAAAISLGEYDKALEWLEQGRSIVWTQILQLRTPVDRLREVDSSLANRLLQVSRQLDQEVGKDASLMETLPLIEEEEGRRYRALTAEWESIVEQVRALPTFENFLKPPSSSQLMNAAQNGPVVLLNIARARCDALAILPGLDDVIHIPLPNITTSRVVELQDELKDLLYSSGIRMRGERAAKKVAEDSDDQVLKLVLAELWTGIVKPVMDSLAFSPHPDSLPRIWWCATGPLAFLPIHAAGIYDTGAVDSQLSDYVISSYTPTLSALLESTHPKTDTSFKLLSVIQPSAPGATPIPNTKQELDYIRKRLVDRDHLIIEGEDGTKRPVIRGMEQCHWLHLACHGIQRPDEPTKSALILQDGHLTLEEIIGLELPKAEFAFLSACQTTTGDEKLSEEAVHIAGGMMLAGYRGVVATMWSIRDDLAPAVADKFYSHIIRDGERPDSRNAAEALDISVQEIRKMPGVTLTDWIPFVHLGV